MKNVRLKPQAYVEMDQRARRLKLRKPGLFDVVILGTARITGSMVLRGDLHFKDMDETILMG